MRYNPTGRIRFIAIAFFAVALALIARLYYIQIVNGQMYTVKAEEQYISHNYHGNERGTIFFQYKDGKTLAAAFQKEIYNIAIDPRLINDPENAYEALSRFIELDHDRFIESATRTDTAYVRVAGHVDEEVVEKVRELGIKGVGAHVEKIRSNPGEKSAAQTIGFVSFRGNDLAGSYGLERYYENVLRRGDSKLRVNFFAEVFSNLTRPLRSADAEKEGDIILSIEPSIQRFFEAEIEKVTKQWNSLSTAGIIMDPKTGEIIAIAVDPSFDLNDFKSQTEPRIYANPMVEDVYEMGSIMKPLTLAAGLDAGAITAHTTYHDEGHIILNGRRISNYDGIGRGTVDMQKVLNDSLNTGVAYVVSKMGREVFAKYMLNFALGERTGIDLPNEADGLVGNLLSPRDVEFATVSFGQGIAVTPIATARALSVLANGGTLIEPHLVRQINYTSGEEWVRKIEEGKRVISKETSEEITRMLVNTVDEALLGGTVKMNNYSIAAKTGTAQIAKDDGRGYHDDRFMHTFFGYFPAYEPRFLILIYTRQPQGVRFASQTLTAPFMNTARFILNYYEIPPDR
jgi:stage V sporulation protein D (sporulation-specific penicillin-binding protein)